MKREVSSLRSGDVVLSGSAADDLGFMIQLERDNWIFINGGVAPTDLTLTYFYGIRVCDDEAKLIDWCNPRQAEILSSDRACFKVEDFVLPEPSFDPSVLQLGDLISFESHEEFSSFVYTVVSSEEEIKWTDRSRPISDVLSVFRVFPKILLLTDRGRDFHYFLHYPHSFEDIPKFLENYHLSGNAYHFRDLTQMFPLSHCEEIYEPVSESDFKVLLEGL